MNKNQNCLELDKTSMVAANNFSAFTTRVVPDDGYDSPATPRTPRQGDMNGNGHVNGLTPLTNGNGFGLLCPKPPSDDGYGSVPATPRPDLALAAPPSPERDIHYSRHAEEDPLSTLLRTIDFAAHKHQLQRRKDLDQTPYINHPIAVAKLLSSCGVTDINVLQAAVLHDTVEDTNTTIEEIERNFGPEVAKIVAECTDDTNLNGLERKAEQLRLAPSKSVAAQQVKLADKYHNLESIRCSPPVGWGARRVQAYFIWAKQVTDVCAASCPPLAARLQHLYETAHTRLNGEYIPCHPEVCGPLTEEEQTHIDSRYAQRGEQLCPRPIFF